MKITILNGNPDPANGQFEGYLSALEQALQAGQHSVSVQTLRDLNLRNCSGCFGCWVKTPGECVTPDDGPIVCRAVIQADFVLWAAPLKMGFPSATLKRMMDKSIPLIHPYFEVDNNEAHHRPRYAHYPRLGLLLQKEAYTDPEDLRLVTDIFCRTALNMKSRLEFSTTIDQPVGEVVQAITTPTRNGPRFDPAPKPTRGVQIALPARLTLFNGSPRGVKGNTPILFEHFIKGFTSLPGHSTSEVYHLSHTREAERFAQAFGEAECVLLGFPLYTDAMPGLVKAFIESLEPYTARANNPPIGFVVQSGFPEARHSRHVEHYLEKLAKRLNSPYLGTIVKGSVEGIQIMPENMTRKLFDTFFQFGKGLAENGQFDPTLLRGLAQPEYYPAYLAPIFKLFALLPISSFYWDSQLKQNGVYERRFAQPYR